MSQPHELLDAAPQAAEAAADDPLRAFLSGKRQGERYACHIPVRLEGLLSSVAATALDISATGALVQIDEPAFLESEEHGGTQAYLELLSLHVKEGLTLRFEGRDLSRRAEVVRWTAGEAGQGISRVGLRFSEALDDPALAALRSGGAMPGPDGRAAEAAATGGQGGPAEEPIATLPLAPRRGAALEVFVFRSQRPEAGPLVAGRALGAGDGALALRLHGRRPLIEVAGLLAGHVLEVSLQERGRPLHCGGAHVAWILPVADDGSVDVGLKLDEPLARPALRRLRRA